VAIHPVPAAPVVDVVVLGGEARGGERRAVAAGEADAAVAGAGDLAVGDAALLAAHAHGPGADVPQRAVLDAVAKGVLDADGGAAGGLEGEALKGHVLRALEREERVKDGDDGLAILDRLRIGIGGPEVDGAGLTVEVPLAGAVDLAQQVEAVEPPALAVAVVVVRLRERHALRRRINGRDALPLLGPVVQPVAQRPRLLLILPACKAVVRTGVVGNVPLHARLGAGPVDLRRAVDIGDGDEALVGVARDGHRPVAEEEFQPRAARKPEPAADRAEVGDAQRPEVGPHDVPPRRGIEAVQHGGIIHRSPTSDALTPGDADFRARRSAIDDGRRRRARILLRQRERARELVHTGVERDGDAPGGQRPGLPDCADLVPRAFERGERTRRAPITGIVAGGRDMQPASTPVPGTHRRRGQGTREPEREQPRLHSNAHESKEHGHEVGA
jgi:hypothetical protein